MKLTYIFLLFYLSISSIVSPTTYDTTTGPDLNKSIVVSTTNTFNDGEYARGFVKFAQGFTLTSTSPTNNYAPTHIDVTEVVDGDIYLNGLTLYLDGDLYLGKNAVIHGPGTIRSNSIVQLTYIPWDYYMPIPFYPGSLPPGGGYLRGFITTEGNVLHTLNNLTVTNNVILGGCTLNGHGNNLYFVNSTGFTGFWTDGFKLKNIILHGATNFSNSTVAFEDATLDVRNTLDGISFAQHTTVLMTGNNKIIGRNGQYLHLSGAEIFLDQDTSLTIGNGLIWSFDHNVGKYSAVHFKNKSSTIILDRCSLSLGSSINTKEASSTLCYHEFLQTSLTFSIGTIIVNGTVHISTPKTTAIYYPWTRGTYSISLPPSVELGQNLPFTGLTIPAGFDLNLGGTWDQTKLDVIFNEGARIIAHDCVRVNVLQ